MNAETETVQHELDCADQMPESPGGQIASTSGQDLAVSQGSERLMEAIVQASRDENVDVGKMERLYDMYERIQARNAETQFNQAMNAAQAEMGSVAADADNNQTRSKYATYHALNKALRPIYSRHGFSLSFDTDESPKPDHVRVLCYVSHVAGHTRTYKEDMPADGKGAKGGDVMTKTHATGSANSYGMRYLLKLIFNVAIGEDDDDGNGADPKTRGPQRITMSQAADLENLAGEAEGGLRRLQTYLSKKYGSPDIANIPACDYEHVCRITRRNLGIG